MNQASLGIKNKKTTKIDYFGRGLYSVRRLTVCPYPVRGPRRLCICSPVYKAVRRGAAR